MVLRDIASRTLVFSRFPFFLRARIFHPIKGRRIRERRALSLGMPKKIIAMIFI